MKLRVMRLAAVRTQPEPWPGPTEMVPRQDILRVEPLGAERTCLRVDFRDGARAAFKPRGVQRRARWGYIPTERAHLAEVGAYVVSSLTGLGVVPPTALARIQTGADEWPYGSLQVWVDGDHLDLDGLASASIAALDYLIGNTDRHRGNWLVDRAGQAWALDHAASFPTLRCAAGDAFRGYGRSSHEIRMLEAPWQDQQLPGAVLDGIRVADPQRIWRELLELGFESDAANGARDRLIEVQQHGRIPAFVASAGARVWQAMRRMMALDVRPAY